MKSQKNNFSIVVIAGISLLIGFLGGYLAGYRYGIKLNTERSNLFLPQDFKNQPSSEVLTSQAMEIIKDLNCICSCKMELLPCTCEEPKGAKEIKNLAQGLINTGLTKNEIINHLVRKYGDDVLIKRESKTKIKQ